MEDQDKVESPEEETGGPEVSAESAENELPHPAEGEEAVSDDLADLEFCVAMDHVFAPVRRTLRRERD